MELLEDLGLREYGKQGLRKRWGLYKCPMCTNSFECITSNVARGNTTKCSSCANNTSISVETFIDKASRVHKCMYNYSLVKYIHAHTKVAIVCKIHGVFHQKPNNHLNGIGCPICGGTSKAHAKSTFEDEATITHNNKYDYSLVEYVGSKTKVEIICPEHGVFLQSPNNHKRGQGCPHCILTGFDRNKLTVLYYLRVLSGNTQVYKIGITCRSVQERFYTTDLEKITVLKIWLYEGGEEAYTKEQEILRAYKDFKYLGEPVLSSGNTELFTKDILELDKDTD